MKREIRKGVFETNSSSTHAICVSHEPVDMTEIPIKQICFEHGDFGWENDRYFDIGSKASYLYEAMWECSDDPDISYYDDREKWEEAKTEIVEKQYLAPLTAILNKYDIECLFDDNNFVDDGGKRGCIDHGNELKDFVDKCLTDENYLLSYLFGDSFIITGNDNEYGDTFNEFYDENNEIKSEYKKYDIFEKYN